MTKSSEVKVYRVEGLAVCEGDFIDAELIGTRFVTHEAYLSLQTRCEAAESALRTISKNRGCGHQYNCSSARGSDADCTCGWSEARATLDAIDSAMAIAKTGDGE